MVNKIIAGISQALDAEFNTGDTLYEIYTESIEQGFDEPCFSILNLTANATQLVNNRYSFKSAFDIQYFPSNRRIDGVVRKNNECYEVAIKLMDILESITVNSNIVRGSKMKNETIDDVLHFFVDYNMIVKKDIAKEDSMENLKVNTGLR